MAIQDSVQSSGISKWVLFSFIFSTLFLIPIISGLVVFFSGGGISPIAEATIGKLVDTQGDIFDATEKLKDIKLNPQDYDAFDVDAILNKIVASLLILGFMIYGIYKVLTWDKFANTIGVNHIGFSYIMIVIVSALFILGIAQVGWSITEKKVLNNYSWGEAFSSIDVFETHKDVPYYATINLLMNLDLLKVKGLKDVR